MYDDVFQGKNGFYWFFGTVESNADPMGLGRCRVRIAGYHNPNDSELETVMLPWAYPITPITNAGVGGIGQSPIGPQPGTRIFGFFTDGATGQSPVMLGTIPGGSEYEYKRQLEYGSTPYQPNKDKAFGAPCTREGDCAPGYEEGTARANIVPPDQRLIQASGEWVLPYSGFVSSAYDEARGNNTHNGVDICPAGFFPQTEPGRPGLNGRLRGPTNLPVYAAAEGEVVYQWTADKGQRGVSTRYDQTGRGSRSFGNAIVLRHKLSTGTYTTVYAHLGINQDAGKDVPGAGILVKVGDKVSKGQQIGTVGRTHVYGSLTHLHFEIRLGEGLPATNNHINPGRIFPQLGLRHHEFRRWADKQFNYDIKDLPFDKDDVPVKALEGPA